MAAKQRRRARKTGSIYQRCEPATGCPALVDGPVNAKTGKPTRVRPKHKCKGMWVAVLSLPSDDPKKRRRKQIVRAKKADVIAEHAKALKQLELAGDLHTSSLTVAQWCDIWWERYGKTRLKVSTRDTYRSKIEIYIKPSIGKVPIDRLALDHVYKMHNYVTKTLGLAGASAMASHRVLSVIMTDAEREDRVTRNVVKLAQKPAVGKKSKQFLDSAQARELLMSVKDDLPLAARWATALLTGMRQGERLGLTINALDFKHRVVIKEWQLRRIPFEHGCGDRENGAWPCGRKRGGNCPQRHLDVPEDQEVVQVDGGLFLTRPKTTASLHALPMQDVELFWEIIAAHVEANPPGMNGLIFTRKDGRPIDPAVDAEDWDKSLRAAGLPDVNIHSARHTCNTILDELGVTVDVRKQILGQASEIVNRTVYTHISDVRVGSALGQLSAALDYR